jgi:hypothetical protein
MKSSLEQDSVGSRSREVRTGWNRVIEKLVSLFRGEPREQGRYDYIHRTIHDFVDGRREPNRTRRISGVMWVVSVSFGIKTVF